MTYASDGLPHIQFIEGVFWSPVISCQLHAWQLELPAHFSFKYRRACKHEHLARGVTSKKRIPQTVSCPFGSAALYHKKLKMLRGLRLLTQKALVSKQSPFHESFLSFQVGGGSNQSCSFSPALVSRCEISLAFL
jgi:hypothetical protein